MNILWPWSDVPFYHKRSFTDCLPFLTSQYLENSAWNRFFFKYSLGYLYCSIFLKGKFCWKTGIFFIFFIGISNSKLSFVGIFWLSRKIMYDAKFSMSICHLCVEYDQNHKPSFSHDRICKNLIFTLIVPYSSNFSTKF